jgi:hypothetical protein
MRFRNGSALQSFVGRHRGLVALDQSRALTRPTFWPSLAWILVISDVEKPVTADNAEPNRSIPVYLA